MAQASTLARPKPAAPYVTYEQFLALDGNPHREWVDGEVVPMVSVTLAHALITAFLFELLGAVIRGPGLGDVLGDPFNVRLAKRGRAPDVIVVLREHRHRYRETYLDGPPDIAIEVISPGSAATDRGDKFSEYEEAGIPEYWIIDPEEEVAEFYILDQQGHYQAAPADEWFASKVVPALRVRVAWFWERPAITQALAEMAAG